MNWFSNLVRFNGTNDSISSDKEGTGSPWHDESLDTPNQMPIGSEVLSDHVFVTLEHFSPTKEYSGIGWLLLSSLKKVGNEKDELRASNSQLKLRINDLKAPISVLKELLGPRFLNTKPRASFCQWLIEILFQVFGRLL